MTNDNHKPHYANGTAAGYKKAGTSKDAAEGVQDTLGARQAAVLEAYRAFGEAGATPCQIAERLEWGIDLVRPRVCELVKLKKLFPCGRRMGWRGKAVEAHSAIAPAPLLALDVAA